MIGSICSQPNILEVMRIVNIVIMIIKIVVPIILILFMMLEFMRAISSNDSEALQKAKKSAIGKWWDEHVAPWFTKEKWVDVMKGVKDGFTTTFKNAVNSAIELFNKFINWVNKMLKFEWDAVVVAGQEIVPAGSVQLFTIPNIPKLARGGMLNRGSIFEMGENNKAEMLASYNNRQTVIPLENTSFISALKQAVYEGSLNAQPVGAGGYGDITVPVYIGGKQVSKEVYKMSEEGKKMIGNVIGKGGNFR